jgi:glycosyltransferase involved in cell wall biosynthesis
MSTVSAVVLSYNKARTLERFFASLEAQTRFPDEILIVDDASTDGTGELLRKRFSLYKTLFLEQNGGQARARNLGLQRTNGEYAVFLDGDVVMTPHMLELLEKALDTHPDASVAYGHYERTGSQKGIILAEPWNAGKLEVMNFVSAVSMVRRKDLPIPTFDESLRRYEDWDLWLRMGRAGRKGILVDEVLFQAVYFPEDLSGLGESETWRRVVARKHRIPIR